MGITIKEIAALANVHRSTVDKVLHNREGVSPEVRARIKRIIKETNYKPNSLGQALQKRNETIKIAAVLLNVDALLFLEEGIDKALKDFEDFDVQLTYYTTDYTDVKKQQLIIEQCIDMKVDGIILSPIDSEIMVEAINKAVDAGIEVVTTNFNIKAENQLCYVGQDRIKAGAIAASMMGLMICGRGNVALITVAECQANATHIEGRRKGFVKQIKSEYPNVEIVDEIACYDNPNIVEMKTREMLERNSDLRGIFITGGSVGIIGRIIKEYKLNKKIKIICFESYPEIIKLIKDGTISSTIESDLISEGKLSLEILLNSIIYNKRPESKRIFTKNEIIFNGYFSDSDDDY